MAIVDSAQALQFPTAPTSPQGPHTQWLFHPAGSGGMWLEALVLQSYRLCSDPGFTLPSSVVSGKLLSLLGLICTMEITFQPTSWG